jgi:serine/threonine-protein kinase
MIGEQAGSYRIVDQIGEGGMGVVYAAEHVELGHRVAVKVLRKHFTENADIVQRFFNEARAATRVRHPGIVQIFDFGRLADGTVYFVMELLEGVSLGDLLENGILPESYAAALTRQVAGALGAAHAVKIVHRDLKPDNVVIVRDPDVGLGERAKVLDFGIAKLVDMQGSVSLRTQTGSVMGTPYYMSPEQSRGAGDIDHRSDIYSLGCILFEMVCGQPPFLSDGLGEVIGMHQFEPPPRPSALNAAVSDGLEAVILKTLEKKPDDRYQTMEELAQALSPLATGASGVVVPSGAIPATGSGPIATGAAGASMTARLADGVAPKVATPPPASAATGPRPALATPPAAPASTHGTDRRTVPLPAGQGRPPSSRPKATGAVTTLRDATGESLTQPREPGELASEDAPRGRLRRLAWLAGIATLVAAGTATAVVKLAGDERPAAVALLGDAGVPDAEPALTRRDLGAVQAEFVLGEIERNQTRREWRDVLELYARLPDDASRARAAAARDAARTGYLAEQIAAVQRANGEHRCADATAIAEEAQTLLPDDGDAARLGEIAADCAAPAPDAGVVAVAPVPTPTPAPARPPVRAPGRPAVAVATADAAEQALRSGDPRKALSIAETVLRRSPKDSRALTVAGLAACHAKNAAKARRYANLLGGQRADAMRSICQRNGIALAGAAPSASLPETPGAAEVTRLLRSIQGKLASCGADYRATSTVRLRIVIGGDGRVKEARADSAPKVAWCMEGAVRSLKFPASRKGMTVNYPVTLR